MGDSPDWTTQLAFQATYIEEVTLNAGEQLSDLVIAQYASLVIFEFASPSGTAGPIVTQFTQAFETGLLFANDSFYATAELTNNNGFMVVAVPALSNYLTIRNRHPTQQCSVVVYGLNVNPIGLRRYLGYAQAPLECATGAVPGGVAGTIYPMPIVDLPAGSQIPNQFAVNGSFSVNGNCSTPGTILIYRMGPNAVMNGIPIATFATAQSFNVTGFYEGFGRLIWVPSVSGSTGCTAYILAGPPAT